MIRVAVATSVLRNMVAETNDGWTALAALFGMGPLVTSLTDLADEMAQVAHWLNNRRFK